jgi:hypothetical protein
MKLGMPFLFLESLPGLRGGWCANHITGASAGWRVQFRFAVGTFDAHAHRRDGCFPIQLLIEKTYSFSDKNELRFYPDFFFPKSARFGLELAACKRKAKRETI